MSWAFSVNLRFTKSNIPMKLSVILPCFNGAETISLQLEALASQQWSGEWEVIVSNNGSTDDSMEIVECYRDRLPNLRIVNAHHPPEPRLGVTHSYNVGIQAATGDAFAFCEADDEVAPGWVAAMAQALAQHDLVAGPLDYTKLNPDWLVKGFGTGIQLKGFNVVEFIHSAPYASGCNMGMRRSLYETIGEINEAIRYVWDMEYCWRVQDAGFQLHFVPDAVVHYRLRQTLGALFRQNRNWGEEQALLRRFNQKAISRIAIVKDSISVLINVLGVVTIFSKARLARWAFNTGWYVGNLQGNVKYYRSDFDPTVLQVPPKKNLGFRKSGVMSRRTK
jgi:glycosyltransferase involved in cell wall biosynthesis